MAINLIDMQFMQSTGNYYFLVKDGVDRFRVSYFPDNKYLYCECEKKFGCDHIRFLNDEFVQKERFSPAQLPTVFKNESTRKYLDKMRAVFDNEAYPTRYPDSYLGNIKSRGMGWSAITSAQIENKKMADDILRTIANAKNKKITAPYPERERIVRGKKVRDLIFDEFFDNETEAEETVNIQPDQNYYMSNTKEENVISSDFNGLGFQGMVVGKKMEVSWPGKRTYLVKNLDEGGTHTVSLAERIKNGHYCTCKKGKGKRGGSVLCLHILSVKEAMQNWEKAGYLPFDPNRDPKQGPSGDDPASRYKAIEL